MEEVVVLIDRREAMRAGLSGHSGSDECDPPNLIRAVKLRSVTLNKKIVGNPMMAAFQIELLHRANERREPFRADRYDIHAPDLAATVVQARALFRALSPGQPTLFSFRIMENGVIGYGAKKGDLA
jgi:hypothetical protein